jgi:multicomponent Na+:H+ antiporter subunit C
LRATTSSRRWWGSAIFQTSVYLLYIAPGKLDRRHCPGDSERSYSVYSNPLPHVLILTAIVVGVATLALGTGAGGSGSRSVRFSIEEDEILKQDETTVADAASAQTG